MTDCLSIEPLARPVDADITVPGSKSITNRALLLAALAAGRSTLEGALFSDDTRYMNEALNALGVAVRGDEAACRFEVQGGGCGFPTARADVFIGNSGTSARFLLAALCLGHGTYRLDGVERMRQRPIGDLLSALVELGVEAKSELDNGCPPVRVQARGLRGGVTHIRGDASSQYLSALLLVAPLCERGIEIEVVGALASRPYIDLTLKMLAQWGAEARNQNYERFSVPGGQSYRAQCYAIEPDASSASYFLAAAAVSGGRVRISGLGRDSLQGDLGFVDVLAQMGCSVALSPDSVEVRGPRQLHGVDVDMNGISDTVMTLAAIAPFCSGPTRIRNVANIRHKETDRIHALVTELHRLGVPAWEFADGLSIEPLATLRPAAIETYDDHRMAMSFAITGLRAPGVSILDPRCVNKTFPGFFERLAKLRTA